MNYYYSGEFGYFNVIILPSLEKYNSGKEYPLFTIYTFPDYCYIIKNLFENKFDCKEIPLIKLRLLHNNLEEADYKQFIPINNLLNTSCIWQMNHFDKISKIITTDININNKNEDFICYFPRFRDSGKVITDFEKRNAKKNECESILDLLSKHNIKVYI